MVKVVVVLSVLIFLVFAQMWSKSKHLTSSEASTAIYVIFIYLARTIHNTYAIRPNLTSRCPQITQEFTNPSGSSIIIPTADYENYPYEDEGRVYSNLDLAANTKGNDVLLGFADKHAPISMREYKQDESNMNHNYNSNRNDLEACLKTLKRVDQNTTVIKDPNIALKLSEIKSIIERLEAKTYVDNKEGRQANLTILGETQSISDADES
eukprot:104965_1